MTKRALTTEDLWNMARVGTPIPVPGREAAVVTVKRFDLAKNVGVDCLWLVPYDGSAARALTTAEHGSASQPALSPDGLTLAFVRKPAGKTVGQLHVMSLDGGEPRVVTDLPLGASDPRFMPDGKSVVVVSEVFRTALTLETARTALEADQKSLAKVHVTEDRVYKFWDRWLTRNEVPHLFVVDVATGAARDLLPESTRWFDLMDPGGCYDISPDGTELAFSACLSEPPFDKLRWGVFVVPTAAGATPRCLTTAHTANDERPRYSPDGRWLAWGMSRDPDFYADRVRLVRFERSNGKIEVLTEAWDRSAGGWGFTPDSQTLVIEAEEQGRSRLFSLPVAGGTPSAFVREGTAHGARAVDAERVVFAHDSLCHPPEVTLASLDGTRIERIGHFNDALLAELELGRTDELHIAGADGDAVQTWLVYPPGYDATKKYPLVHMIHGGPHGTFADQWHFRWNVQLFASPGYVVALVNFHGSSSFGEKWARSIHGAWGDKPTADVLAATDHLVGLGIVDPARMAITGGSFGGYLTSWLCTVTDRFACAIAHAAVTSLPGMYAGDITEGLDREIGAAPWDDRVVAERFSPTAWAGKIRTPVLVVHGEKDFRVPGAQGLELYGILKARGLPARLVYFPGENHWILEPASSVRWYAEVHGWLARWLTPT